MENEEIRDGIRNYREYSPPKIYDNIKKYAEVHTALFIFLSTTIVTGVSLLVKLFFYAYQIGYNQFFDIPNRYIELSGNFFYKLSMYVAIAIIMLMLNAIAYNFLERRELYKYFFRFTLILICILLFFSFIVDYKAFIDELKINLIMILFVSILFVFALHCFTIVNYFSQDISIKITRLSILIEQKQKKLEKLKTNAAKSEKPLNKMFKFKIEKLSRKIKKLESNLEKLEDIKSNRYKDGAGNKINKKMQLHPVLIFISIFAFILIGICSMGYFIASSEQYIKIIPNECLNLKIGDEEGYDYAVLFENDSIYLICPCQEEDEKILKLVSEVQVEINKEDIVAVKKKYEDIK